ncbi:MAG: hypothetical protein PHD76_00130 [Methylacidiphilales bacterium]|nr:hypothetical protein [Candidatus Methylacidiphilales bacterium]
MFLEQAIAKGSHFTFETTLGGKTITDILIDAAKKGAVIRIWYAGLESLELHLQRVASRVKKGGMTFLKAISAGVGPAAAVILSDSFLMSPH